MSLRSKACVSIPVDRFTTISATVQSPPGTVPYLYASGRAGSSNVPGTRLRSADVGADQPPFRCSYVRRESQARVTLKFQLITMDVSLITWPEPKKGSEIGEQHRIATRTLAGPRPAIGPRFAATRADLCSANSVAKDCYLVRTPFDNSCSE